MPAGGDSTGREAGRERDMKASEVIVELEGRRDRSAWDRGFTSYAVGMLEGLEPGAELAPGGVREPCWTGRRTGPPTAGASARSSTTRT